MVTEALRATVAALIGLAAAAALGAEPPASRIPVETFVQEPEFYNPVLSPDGEHLVVTARTLIDGRQVPIMTIYNLKQGAIRTRIKLPVFQVPLTYAWVSNTRLIVAKGQEIGPLEAPVSTGEILAMDVDGSRQDYLYGHDMFRLSSRGVVNQDDQGSGYIHSLPTQRNGRFFLREYKWVRDHEHSFLLDINAVNATRRLAAEVPVGNLDFLLHRTGEPRFAFGGDANHDFVFFRRTGDKDEWKQLSIEEVGGRLEPLAFAANDQDFYAMFSADGGPRALVRQGLEGKGRAVMAAHASGDMSLLQWTSRPRVPFAAATRVGIPALKYFDETHPDSLLHKAIAAQFPDHYVRFISFSDDGRLLLFGIASDRDPGGFYLFDRTTGEARALFAVAAAIDPARMAERRPIRFEARDGTALHGFLTLPPGREPKALPMVLLPHGGPHGSSDGWFFDNDAQFLASRGYAVLQVNYRGSGGRGDKFEIAGHRQWGGKIQDDLVDAVKWATAQGFADAARVCSYGASFGAYSAMMVAVRAPGLLRCAVGYAGVYDLPYIYQEEGTRASKRNQNFFARVIGQDATELAAFSPTRQADKVKVPVLLAHGEEDRTAPPEHARLMREALVKAGNSPQWMMVPNEAHGFYAVKNRVAFYKALEDFLAKHLAP